MIILYVLPIIAIALGIALRKDRYKGLYCLIISVVLALFTFLFRGESYTFAEAAYNAVGGLGIEELGKASFPLGMMFLAKPFSILSLGSDIFAVTVLAAASLGFGCFIYYFSKNPIYGGVAFIALGFPFIVTENISPAIAVLISAFGMKYMEERRFFRFCGFALLAACFSPSALLLIPAYLLLLPNNLIVKWALSVMIAAVLVFLPFKDELFGFVYYSGTPCETPLPVYFSVIVVLFSLIFTLMGEMIKRNKMHGRRLLGVIILAAAISIPTVMDGRFLPLFIFLAVPSMTTLFSEGLPIMMTLLLKTFPEKQKPVYITAISLFSVLALLFFTFTLFSGVFTLPTLSII